MSYNARVRENKKRGYSSWTFSIVENWRDESREMKNNHRDVAYFGTIKEHFIYSPIIQRNLWLKIDIAINKLLKSGEIDSATAAKIVNRFAEFVPRVKFGAIGAVSGKIPLQSQSHI